MDSDSDFYGDEEEIRGLESRVAEFNPADHWRDRSLAASSSPAVPIKQEPGTAVSSSHAPAPSHAGVAAASQLHNPYEGRPSCAKQLKENIEAFLARLPPATTDVSLDCPWIFVANPFIPREDRGGQEAPAEFGAQLDRFVEGGEARLEMLGDLVRELQEKTAAAAAAAAGGQRRGGRGGGPSRAAVAREVAKQREGCANDILMLAKMLKVRTGKWMLFVDPALIDDVWAAVARATVRNELGISAKVAPREGGRGSSRERLVCIYTYDFSDRQDVGRVLGRLRELELVRAGPGRRPIYYKADAYTHLGIASGNHWGLKASLYSSSEVFAQNKERGERAPASPVKKEEEEEEEKREVDGWTF